MNCRDEAYAGIKIARRNINNLRYAGYCILYNTTLIIESKEEVKSLLMKVKEESAYFVFLATFAIPKKPRKLHAIGLLKR